MMRRGAEIVAWLGGLLFVIALGFFLYAYLVTYGETPPASAQVRPSTALQTNLALFSLFAAHHSLLARVRFKAWIARLVPPDLERSTYVWVASLLFVLTCAAWRRTGVETYSVGGIAAGILFVVQASGVLLIVQSVRRLDHLAIAGIRQVQPITGQSQAPLQIRGVYRIVRHPLYLGWMLFVFGAPHMTFDRLSFAAISSAYLLVAIPWEERSLLREFGAQYETYRRAVRWRVVPWIY